MFFFFDHIDFLCKVKIINNQVISMLSPLIADSFWLVESFINIVVQNIEINMLLNNVKTIKDGKSGLSEDQDQKQMISKL